MPRLIKCADELYEKHKRMIYKLIHNYAKDGYADFGDLESLSNEVFTKCFHKWNPGKAAFSTFFYTALSNAFKSELNKSACRLRNEGEAAWHNLDGPELTSKDSHKEIRSSEWLLGFLQDIDKDARQVVAKMFRHEATKRKNPVSKKDTKAALEGAMLIKPEWTKARVKRAFKNIKMALGT